MKVLYAQDFDFIVHSGGAQMTDRSHFLEGIRRGHDIRIWNPESGIDDSDLKGDMKVIASNPLFLHTETFQMLLDRNVPYVWLFHDYAPICKYRLFYPMRESCRLCYLKERWLPYLVGAKMIIWLSPLHRSSWLWLCPELELVPFCLVPSPIRVDDFYDLNLPRQGVIAVESLHPFKGRDQVLRWAEDHSEVEVNFVGSNPDPNSPLPPNCRCLGQVPEGRMNEVYNQHKVFLHLPQNPSPFDRTVAEAYLAGCKVVGNELIGALSYDWFRSREQVAEHCRSSSRMLWEKLEEVLAP